MVDYREILRLQSLGHNITQIAGSLRSSRNTVCLVHNKNTQSCRGDSSKLQREFPQ